MSSSERSIPHLRDIFSINSYSSGYNYTTSATTQSQTNHNPHNNNDIHHHHHNQIMAVKPSSRKKRDSSNGNNKTLTPGDIKTLERHLSMKKTIRKKIMRDLQQMYTDDPNEFKVDKPDQLKSQVRTDVLRFGERPPTTNATNSNKKSDNFLDMLRSENTYNNANVHQQRRDYDYDTNNATSQKEKQSFWKRFTMKGKSSR